MADCHIDAVLDVEQHDFRTITTSVDGIREMMHAAAVGHVDSLCLSFVCALPENTINIEKLF